MRRRMMKSKIHRATVTDANLNYVGSITIDSALMHQANLLEWEQVAVVDIDNGNRFETYVIPGGPGAMCLNGAAARLVQPGDKVIVISYADYEDAELERISRRPSFMSTATTVRSRRNSPPSKSKSIPKVFPQKNLHDPDRLGSSRSRDRVP